MKRGFTLIELMIVVAIFAILLAVIIPVIASCVERSAHTDHQSVCTKDGVTVPCGNM